MQELPHILSAEQAQVSHAVRQSIDSVLCDVQSVLEQLEVRYELVLLVLLCFISSTQKCARVVAVCSLCLGS